MLHRLSLLLLLLCSAIVAPHTLRVYDMKARDIETIQSDNVYVHVTVSCDNRHMGTTKGINATANLEWTDSFLYRNATVGNVLKLKVEEKTVRYEYWLGTCFKVIRTGSYKHTCDLISGGHLEYKYSLL